MYVLRMNEEMQELVRTSVVIEESDCILVERSALAAVLAQAAAKVKEEKKRAARMNGCGADTKTPRLRGIKIRTAAQSGCAAVPDIEEDREERRRRDG
jgi:phage gp16-like protein